MRVYRTFDEIDFNNNTVLTVGTFDGVHQGHQLIIDRLLKNATELDLRPLLLTFHPHPQIVLQKDNLKPIELLTTIEERLELFEKFNLTDVLIIPFSKEFSKTSPEDFVKKYLIERVGMRKILIGFDHMFGKDRGGNEDLLNKMSREYEFEIEKIGPLLKEGNKVSSSKIRQSLENHLIKEVNDMLGYNYFVIGKVITGDGRGKTIGLPTANIAVPEFKQIPANAVYLVSSNYRDKKIYGMANIGTRPTFTEGDKTLLEVHFFDFQEEIYGTELKIEFLDFIRLEKKFDGTDQFLAQIEKDKKLSIDMIKYFNIS